MLLSPAVCLLHRVGAPHGVEETEDSATLSDVRLMSDAESDRGSWDDDDPQLSLKPLATALPTAATRQYRQGDRVYWKKSRSDDRDKKHVRYRDRGLVTGVDSDGTIYVKFGDSEQTSSSCSVDEVSSCSGSRPLALPHSPYTIGLSMHSCVPHRPRGIPLLRPTTPIDDSIDYSTLLPSLAAPTASGAAGCLIVRRSAAKSRWTCRGVPRGRSRILRGG